MNKATLKEAADWYAVLADDSVTLKSREQWQYWLDANPSHKEAWEHISSVSRRFERIREGDDSNFEVVSDSLSRLQQRRLTKRSTLKSLLLFAGLGVGSWLSVTESQRVPDADYVSDRGEIKELKLSDGSKVWLNTASHMDTTFTTYRRSIHLQEGDIFIDTAVDDLARPLIVETQNGNLKALGTRFSVAEEGDQSVLAVYEGRVEIDTRWDSPRVISAGKQIRFSKGHWGVLQAADPARQSWVNHVLLAQEMPLGELLLRLERYRLGYIHVDPDVADIRVMGVFPLDDTNIALDMLAASLGVVVDKRLPWWIRVHA
ncbi:Protein FecR [Zhongshania aliphaticivorans]|uniref:Protein FecR n=1 Tax=Zhongshania aliphaticivorans TaxID=1470434 RepID=A0A5S9PYX1_9GAMM|nr:FecR domain-containing protein [Zhongshania aliphaticivorans]CAA0092759.1 Protein FecR [Zhongshania aliphaticivorans]CAA0110211.1 Protein FecR [Zhongshania aliphaticivorans]